MIDAHWTDLWGSLLVVAGFCLPQKGLPRWRRGALAAGLVVAGYFVATQLRWVEPPPTTPV